jgi:hypothetical protein
MRRYSAGLGGTRIGAMGAAILVFGLLVPSVLRAGANTWTGGRPGGVPDGTTVGRLSADPTNPYIVYGTFGATLYRSGDGGLTWKPIRSFAELRTVLVQPAAPSTIYVGASEAEADGWHAGVFKSNDGGETWVRTLDDIWVSFLAGSPTDAATVYAGSGPWIYKTLDAGETWSQPGSLSGWIAGLVIHPRESSIVYAVGQGYDYWGLTRGSVVRTTDGGTRWSDVTPGGIEGATAVTVDGVSSSTLYIGTAPYLYSDSTTPNDVKRSEDGGVTWTSAGAGLGGRRIEVLAADPQVAGLLYAGTSAGLFKSRDGGRSWTAFGGQLAGAIHELSIGGGGRRLYAGTTSGGYQLEIARGPVDIAAGSGGESRVLVWNEDRLSLGTVNAAGSWTSGVPGAASSTWTAVALAEGAGRSHVLWQNGDGRSAIEVVGESGRQSVNVFASRADWIPSDVSARADGTTHVLWTGIDGRMFLSAVDPTGAIVDGPVYGPALGWSAVAIAEGSGDTWVLWRSADGRFAVSPHRDGTMVAAYIYVADADWSVEDLAVGADGRPRLLRSRPDGIASVATIDASGRLVSEQSHSLEGLRPGRIASGSDGVTRVLFRGDGGDARLMLLDGANTQKEVHALSSGSQP